MDDRCLFCSTNFGSVCLPPLTVEFRWRWNRAYRLEFVLVVEFLREVELWKRHTPTTVSAVA
ncbi:MAG: hypothetical protein A2V98_04240 [Planctomycetes bacterium RBG_16_64_12]|nr:MAG: hypothetical protein A2V98_04240 [Planctomycetes bacterium RBG_16_64_12]